MIKGSILIHVGIVDGKSLTKKLHLGDKGGALGLTG